LRVSAFAYVSDGESQTTAAQTTLVFAVPGVIVAVYERRQSPHGHNDTGSAVLGFLQVMSRNVFTNRL
jgi:hypothetical protein